MDSVGEDQYNAVLQMVNVSGSNRTDNDTKSPSDEYFQ